MTKKDIEDIVNDNRHALMHPTWNDLVEILWEIELRKRKEDAKYAKPYKKPINIYDLNEVARIRKDGFGKR